MTYFLMEWELTLFLAIAQRVTALERDLAQLVEICTQDEEEEAQWAEKSADD